MGGCKKNKKNCTIIDLFAGCGGLSFGLSRAGFKVLLGVDNWQDALDTFQYNHAEAKIICQDVTKLSSGEIKKTAGRKIDIIVGGPPCQGFSLSGPRNFYDERNRLYLEFLRVVKEIKPRAFIIENVPGLSGLFSGQVKERVIKEFSNLGYVVNAKILNASDYGVPQNRKRIFFVGLKNGELFDFPAPTHFETDGEAFLNIVRPKITVGQAISDLPEPSEQEKTSYQNMPKSEYQVMMRSASRFIYNHVATEHSSRTVEIISLVPEGKNYKFLPEDLQKTRNFHIAWTRLDRSKPAPTVDTGHRHHFHPVANRVPTVRESARLQSFPDAFIFKGTKTSQYKQVGNAVPPLMAEALGKQLLKYL